MTQFETLNQLEQKKFSILAIQSALRLPSDYLKNKLFLGLRDKFLGIDLSSSDEL
tara:strand:+ start:14 stop:178 length:165 start_codon:yes stop_codon:yes gene_type:complete